VIDCREQSSLWCPRRPLAAPALPLARVCCDLYTPPRPRAVITKPELRVAITNFGLQSRSANWSLIPIHKCTPRQDPGIVALAGIGGTDRLEGRALPILHIKQAPITGGRQRSPFGAAFIALGISSAAGGTGSISYRLENGVGFDRSFHINNLARPGAPVGLF